MLPDARPGPDAEREQPYLYLLKGQCMLHRWAFDDARQMLEKSLARLPQAEAIQRLALLIAPLPDGPSTHRDLGTTADRLIALLPRPGDSGRPGLHGEPYSAGAT